MGQNTAAWDHIFVFKKEFLQTLLYSKLSKVRIAVGGGSSETHTLAVPPHLSQCHSLGACLTGVGCPQVSTPTFKRGIANRTSPVNQSLMKSRQHLSYSNTASRNFQRCCQDSEIRRFKHKVSKPREGRRFLTQWPGWGELEKLLPLD